MKDLQDPRWMYAKAGLFVVVGLLASALLLVEHPTLRNAALLVIAVWAFARAYYFAFYVIQHYTNDEFKFSGLGAFAMHLLRNSSRQSREVE